MVSQIRLVNVYLNKNTIIIKQINVEVVARVVGGWDELFEEWYGA